MIDSFLTVIFFWCFLDSSLDVLYISPTYLFHDENNFEALVAIEDGVDDDG